MAEIWLHKMEFARFAPETRRQANSASVKTAVETYLAAVEKERRRNGETVKIYRSQLSAFADFLSEKARRK